MLKENEFWCFTSIAVFIGIFGLLEIILSEISHKIKCNTTLAPETANKNIAYFGNKAFTIKLPALSLTS